MGRPTEIIVVPHTHWDREWYEPFQRFRLRLVALLDDVFDRMERDPRQRFTLDGQLAAVDDYLEVRPERREQVIALVRAGRLAVGPWQILLDEFLCSGENIVRNLERGLARSADLGGAMPVGYLPDMFGHIAQMPQILAGAGLAHACVFRGVPEGMHRHAFAWQAPDGTTVRTEYLPGGYGNAAALMEDPAQITRRAADLAGKLADWRFDGEDTPVLAMYGTDHAAPAPDAPDLLAAADLADVRLRLGTLAEYFATQPATVDGLPVVRGELRSHARANILPGVISVRGHLKRAMNRAERRVERYAEPLAALTHDGSVQRFLDMAWTRLIDASCHDSVTGCGCDETAEQVAARLAEADQLGRAVCDLVGARLAAAVPRDGYLVFNPTPAARTAVVRLDVAAPADATVALADAAGRSVAAQVLDRGRTLLADDLVPAADLPAVLTRVHGRELYGQEVAAWSVSPDDATLTFQVARHGDPAFDVADVRLALAAAGPHDRWRVRILAAPRATVAALVEVPPLGRAAVRPVPLPATADPRFAPVRVAGRSVDNGLLRVDVAEDGTLALSTPDGVTVDGVGRVVDGGDVGDSYNYAPPAADEAVDKPRAVRTVVRHDGPLVAVLDVVREYRWPVAADVDAGSRAVDHEAIVVTTRVELRCGEPFVRLRVEFDNRCDDHRVRLHLPLPSPADTSYAEGQFAVVRRGLTAEGGGGEVPLPTFPANGFVAAGGPDGALAVLLTQPTEYELTDSGGELAVTLLRSIGMLSRNRHALRDEPAGPQLPTPEAQCRGLRTVELAVLPYRGGWHSAGVLAAAEAYRHELLAFPGTADPATELPAPAVGLAVDGAGVALTSVRDRAGRTEVRLVAQTPTDTVAVLGGADIRGACRADLLGRPGEPLGVDGDGRVRVPLRAWEIATVQLDLG
ncbi:glycoside hydrolase family 38 C-terminal domain-containing protein [Micromonospora sp. C28SCA-DRY-2]|uniref:glycoside hydrolase family 38 N-terminal domain-containing protein n=1 Tax=Micromonospora sp. C28SCA-DRY-2 TaxID=3059522 RepID=UPI002674DB61|nr:glycoside hydrolase family 38 C-terminal domain-containing protein [Micromonospora sp. C28SCA-DRY-2]MDO3705104.1 glycoside hydrolase family 38 C-terminal domain-containing protein [Micromonospora sp. C28SCA-DRY-2]